MEECPACLGEPVEAVILTCGHSFCRVCVSDLTELQGLKERKSQVITCPGCRGKTYIQGGGVQNLPQNVLVDAIRGNRGNQREICGICFNNPANSLCLACDFPICQPCCDLHRLSSWSQYHKVRPISPFLSCAVHSQPLDLYCLLDCVFLCLDCAKDHSLHEVLALTEARLALAQEFDRGKERIREVMEILNEDKYRRQKRLEMERFEGEIEKNAIQKLGNIDDLIQQFESMSRENDIFAFLTSFQASKSLHQLVLPSLSSADSPLLTYIHRGSASFLLYSFPTHSVATLSLAQETFPRWSISTALNSSEVAITGGKLNKGTGALSNARKLNIQSCTLEGLPDMLGGHSSHVSVHLDGKLYIFGGKNMQNVTHNGCEVLDISQRVWRSLAFMQIGRTCAGATALQEAVYVLGGYSTMVERSIEYYSIACDTWTLAAITLPDNIWQHSCWCLGPSQILVFGGESCNEEVCRVSFLLDTGSGQCSGFQRIPARPGWLFFWVNTVQRDCCLYAMNKDSQVLRYSMAGNQWFCEE